MKQIKWVVEYQWRTIQDGWYKVRDFSFKKEAMKFAQERRARNLHCQYRIVKVVYEYQETIVKEWM